MIAAGGVTVTADDVDALLVGLALLGSGGGGDPVPFGPALRRALAATPMMLLDPADAGPTVAVGMVGGTRMLSEKLPSGREMVSSVRALERWTGEQATAVMPYEAAGMNGVLALLAADTLGLPLVDADLMGRALPRMDNFTRAVAGNPLTPCAMTEPGGQTVLVDAARPDSVERIARGFVAQAGGWAGCAFAAATPGDDCCHGSLARALALGRAHAALPRKAPAVGIAAGLGGRLLGAGRAVEIARHASEGFGRAGIAVIDDGGAVLRIEAENEYLLVLVDGRATATCPDLLCVLDRRTATPIAVDALRVGDDVAVVVLPGPVWWRTNPVRAERIGPRAFGLDADPVLLP